MNVEDRLFKQVEELSSSIMRALESLEKELSEYIESTDHRLHSLEEKIQKIESYIEVTSKGMTPKTTVSTSSTITQPPPVPITRIPEKPQTFPVAVKEQSIIPSSTPVSRIEPPSTPITRIAPPTSSTTISIEKEEKSHLPQAPTSATSVPPIPRPPSFTPTLERDEESGLISLPERKESIHKKPEGSIATELEEKKKKEQDKDKEELMSALKMIDEL